MVGNFYYYPKNGHRYRVLQEVKAKNPSTGEWKDSVLYTDGDSTYVREKEDFINKFKLIEDGKETV